ncbi:MAG TPA: tRNA uridine-5-carboxymethylaminomethyl(34) synthesis GTPase MnmE [Stenotrophobium sp.]|nr:tRNA uridine-5-carboxymethylaminomethyl(34) synthesis GTPase MnmE [Stenotrophobium sp.]
MPPATDTIAAIATPAGRGALGVIRISGPLTRQIVQGLAGPLPSPRAASLRNFRTAADGGVLDQGLLLWFPGPHSFTGEDVAELQGHGGPVVLDLLLRAVCAQGARIARPGEFSERAFLNGRMDLAQAEAIADLIDAASAEAATAALRSLEGEFSRRVTAIVEALTQLRIHVEGALDFSDEDIPWLAHEALRLQLTAVIERLQELLGQAAQGRRLREGITLTLTGQPNVGKSTLLNRLAGTDAAIVTEIAGTTRDTLRENIVLSGIPLTIVDTAGLRESEDAIEREGIRRAWQALEKAEIALFLVDDRVGLTETDRALLKKLPDSVQPLVVGNKCDLSLRAAGHATEAGYSIIRLSAARGDGVQALIEEILRRTGALTRMEGVFSARTRHVEALQHALSSAAAARQHLEQGASAELAAEELRLAQQALGEITGEFTSDDLLGRVFSQFCIGK